MSRRPVGLRAPFSSSTSTSRHPALFVFLFCWLLLQPPAWGPGGDWGTHGQSLLGGAVLSYDWYFCSTSPSCLLDPVTGASYNCTSRLACDYDGGSFRTALDCASGLPPNSPLGNTPPSAAVQGDRWLTVGKGRGMGSIPLGLNISDDQLLSVGTTPSTEELRVAWCAYEMHYMFYTCTQGGRARAWGSLECGLRAHFRREGRAGNWASRLAHGRGVYFETDGGRPRALFLHRLMRPIPQCCPGVLTNPLPLRSPPLLNLLSGKDVSLAARRQQAPRRRHTRHGAGHARHGLPGGPLPLLSGTLMSKWLNSGDSGTFFADIRVTVPAASPQAPRWVSSLLKEALIPTWPSSGDSGTFFADIRVTVPSSLATGAQVGQSSSLCPPLYYLSIICLWGGAGGKRRHAPRASRAS